MKRLLAAMLAAMVVSGAAAPLALAEDHNPFETIPQARRAPHPHRAAYLCFLTGAGLIVGSFALANHADAAYDRYLDATDPDEISSAFDEATRYDRLSSGALITGEVMIAGGLYLRFLRRPSPPVALRVTPGACALTLRF